MDFPLISLMTDVIIMATLAVTIFYAVLLSRHLKNFRDQRDAFMNVLGDFSGQIDEAQTAVHRLNNAAEQSGKDLQEAVNEAKRMLTELQVVNQSAGALAQRLEKLKAAPQNKDFSPRPLETMERSPAFFIQDRDFAEGASDTGFDEEDDGDAPAFQSKAEKDLWKFLRRNKKFTGSGMA